MPDGADAGQVPLDPDLAAVVAAIQAANVPPPFSGTPAEARMRLSRAVIAARAKTTPPVVASMVDTVAVHGDLAVPVRIYRPFDLSGATALFLHGGGFVIGSIDLMDDIARKLCRDTGAVVVSVEYRLAPEHPYPAAHHDALAAALWMHGAVADLGGDPARMALVGESAGANLAACTALAFRDRGIALAAQVLIVPGVDMARDIAALEAARCVFPMLTPADLRDINRLYMGTRAAEAAGCPPSPLRADSLAAVAPAIVAVAGHDPLQGEGLAYADRLRRADVPVTELRFADMFHPFMAFFPQSEGARRANDQICLELRKMLETLVS